MYYPFSENKGADQLRGYREADLRLCFRICKIRFSHDAAHMHTPEITAFNDCVMYLIREVSYCNNSSCSYQKTMFEAVLGPWRNSS